MWVTLAARGHGVGDALVAAVIRWADEQKARRVILCVRDANPHAIALYSRYGFVESGIVERCSQDAPERRMSYDLYQRRNLL
jgi:ribosomal protein S18 acetylase RimI-like enzyme